MNNKIGISAIGLMVLIALSPYAIAEPDTKIEIHEEELKIEFVNFNIEDTWSIDFIKGHGSGSNIITVSGTIPETTGYAYYVAIGESETESSNGEFIDLSTGPYHVVATVTRLLPDGTVLTVDQKEGDIVVP